VYGLGEFAAVSSTTNGLQVQHQGELITHLLDLACEHAPYRRDVVSVGPTLIASQFPSFSITGLGDDGGVTSDSEKEFSEFGIDVLITTVGEIFDVLDNLQESSALVQRLR